MPLYIVAADHNKLQIIQIVSCLLGHMRNPSPEVLQAAAVAAGYYILNSLMADTPPPHDLMVPFAKVRLFSTSWCPQCGLVLGWDSAAPCWGGTVWPRAGV